jgi:hypothetical protein
MAEVNGMANDGDTISVSTSHLGKRKRTASPEPPKSPAKPKPSSQATLEKLLQFLRR